MKGLKILYIVLILILYVSVTVISQASPEKVCEGLFWLDGAYWLDGANLKLAKLVGPKNAKIHFLKSNDGCPKTKDLNCINKSYVIPGDQVLISTKYGNRVCSWYQKKKGGETIGWLPVESLVISEPDANQPLERWVGDWKYYGNSINISRDNKTEFLTAEGNQGAFSAKSKPQGNELVLEEEACHIALRLIGNFIIANADSACGGDGGSFSGVYVKPGSD